MERGLAQVPALSNIERLEHHEIEGEGSAHEAEHFLRGDGRPYGEHPQEGARHPSLLLR